MQREFGARRIAERVQALAKDAGIEQLVLEWNASRGFLGRQQHSLIVSTHSNQHEAQFSDDQLADYPAAVGTAESEAAIRSLVAKLRP